MIECRSKLQNKKIEIDLNSECGNAFYLLGLVDNLGKQIKLPKEIRNDVKETMMMGNYDQLIKTFDIWFGNYVTLYK
jgi:hypothetical protein